MIFGDTLFFAKAYPFLIKEGIDIYNIAATWQNHKFLYCPYYEKKYPAAFPKLNNIHVVIVFIRWKS